MLWPSRSPDASTRSGRRILTHHWRVPEKQTVQSSQEVPAPPARRAGSLAGSDCKRSVDKNYCDCAKVWQGHRESRSRAPRHRMATQPVTGEPSARRTRRADPGGVRDAMCPGRGRSGPLARAHAMATDRISVLIARLAPGTVRPRSRQRPAARCCELPSTRSGNQNSNRPLAFCARLKSGPVSDGIPTRL
jgi:hypothetical protein